MAYVILEDDKSKIYRVANRLGARNELMLQIKPEGHLLADLPLAWGRSVIDLVSPSAD